MWAESEKNARKIRPWRANANDRWHRKIFSFVQRRRRTWRRNLARPSMMQSSTSARQVIILLGITVILVDLPNTSHRAPAYM